MEKLFLTFLVVFIISINSCTNPSAHFFVWQGNNNYSRGDYQSSNNNYLKAQKTNDNSYINYNLGNVYYSLGETSSALSEWQKAVVTKNDELLFKVIYNRGVLEFEKGQYQKAFNSFKSALEIMPKSMDAKINLEYSLKKMNTGLNQQPASLAGAQTKDSEDFNEISRVLDFVKQKETYILKNSEEINIDNDAMDW